jgi:hypothetical protein
LTADGLDHLAQLCREAADYARATRCPARAEALAKAATAAAALARRERGGSRRRAVAAAA